jgi:hypothetical protein
MTEPNDGRDEAAVSPEALRLLEPGHVRLEISPGGLLTAVLGGQRHVGVTAAYAFPRTAPGLFLAITDREGRELGVVPDEAALDGDSRTALARYLRLHEGVPQVLRIRRVRHERSRWRLLVDTDRGPMDLLMPNLHEHVELPGGDRVLLRDVDGRVCEVPDWRALDAASRRQLAQLL